MTTSVDRGTWSSQILPGNWCWVKFAEFFSDQTDSKRKVPKQSYLESGDFPVIDQGEVRVGGYSNDRELVSQASLPVVVWGDHTRCIKFIEGPFVQGADGVKVLRPLEHVDPQFAHLAMRSVSLPDKGYSRHFKFLKSTEFPLAPLSEQKRIVAKVESLTAKSTRARAGLDRISYLVTKYKRAFLASAFSELGNPIKLGQLADFVTSGSRGWARYYSVVGAAFVRVGNVRRDHIALDLSEMQYVSPPEGAEGERTRLRDDDIVITITADLGRIGLVPKAFGEAYVNQHVALVRLKNAEHASFIAWFLMSEQGQSQLLERNRGATRAGLGLDDIRAVSVPLPSVLEQHKIVRRIETAFAKIDRLAAEAKRALELTDRLDEKILAKAFRGELVPQDPNDEPASVLLERIRAERAAAPKAKRGRKATA